MSTLKNDAEALRLGLITGTSTIADVVAWADSIILADRSLEAPTVLDLSVASRRPVPDVVSMLSAVPGAVDPHGTLDEVRRDVIACLERYGNA